MSRNADAYPGRTERMLAPLSLVISAFAPVRDVRRTLTPQLRTDLGPTALVLIDLGLGRNRIGGPQVEWRCNRKG